MNYRKVALALANTETLIEKLDTITASLKDKKTFFPSEEEYNKYKEDGTDAHYIVGCLTAHINYLTGVANDIKKHLQQVDNDYDDDLFNL